MATKFDAQVSDWVRETKARQRAVLRESAERLFVEAQTVGPNARDASAGAGGKMPVDLGNLRGSFVAGIGSMPPSPPANTKYDESAVLLSISGVELGDVIYAGWGSEYALRMEYGFKGEDKLGRKYDQEGYGFMRSAAQNWTSIVDDVAKETKARFK